MINFPHIYQVIKSTLLLLFLPFWIFGQANLSGNIQRENLSAIKNVNVNISGDLDEELTTTNTGNYNLSDIPTGSNITITPTKDGNAKDCVTTYDIVLIRAHVINLLALSPYQKIAADVNDSHQVTTFDIRDLRKIILNFETDFYDTPIWQFVDAAYTFPNPFNPWVETFPESVVLNDIMTDTQVDFVAMKTGDVSNCEETILPPQVTLMADNLTTTYGETITMPIRVKDFTNLVGTQFAMKWNPNLLEFSHLINFNLPHLNHSSFNTNNNGLLICSWLNDNLEGVILDDNTIIFEIVFNVIGHDETSPISFVETPTQFEAIDYPYPQRLDKIWYNFNLIYP